MKDKPLTKRMDLVEEVCSKRLKDLILNQQAELSHFNKQRDEEKMKLKKSYKSELEVTRSLDLESAVRIEKLNRLNQELSKKMVAFDLHMKFQRRKLAVMQVDARNKERKIKDQWLEETKAGKPVELFHNLPLSESGFVFEGFMSSKHGGACDDSVNTKLVSGFSSDNPCNDRKGSNHADLNKSSAILSEIPVTLTNKGVADMPVDIGTSPSQCSIMKDLEFVELDEANAGIQATDPIEMVHHIAFEAQSPETALGVSVDTASQCHDMDEVECAEPAEESTESSTVPAEVACAMAIRTESLEADPLEVVDASLKGGMEVIPMETDTLASQRDQTRVMEPAKLGETSMEKTATVSLGVTSDFQIEAESPASNSNFMNELENMADARLTKSGMATVGDDAQHGSVDHSEVACDMTIETEPLESTPGVADGILQGRVEDTHGSVDHSKVACDMTIEAGPFDTTPGVADGALQGGVEDTPMEAETLASQCDNIRVMSPAELSVIPMEKTATVSHGVTSDLQIQAESRASNSNAMNELENMADAICSELGMATVVDIGQRGSMDPSDNACLISSVQGQTEISSMADASTSYGGGSFIASFQDQVPSSNENERLVISVTVENDQGFLTPQQTMVPVLNSVSVIDSHIVQISHNLDRLDSLHLQSTPSGDIFLVRHNPVSPPAFGASEEHPSDQRHCSTQQIEARIQQPVLAGSVQVDSSDQLVSRSNPRPLSPPTTTAKRRCFEDLRSSSQQTQCSTQQAETLMQRPIAAMILQTAATEQSHQFDDQSNVHALPLSATTPERTCSGDLCNSSHETSCSAQPAEALRQPNVATEGQIEQSNQVANQTVLHPVVPSSNAPVDRTNAEDISSANLLPESGSRTLQMFPLANWMPPQGLPPDPLQFELMRLQKQQDICNKIKEDKKHQLKLERDLETEKVRRKYEALLQTAEAELLRDRNFLDTIYNKVLMNRNLADQFRAKFIESKRASVHGQGSRARQLGQVSQPQVVQRPASALTFSLPNQATLPPILAPVPPNPTSALASPGLRPLTSAIPSVMPSEVSYQTSSAFFPSNPVRTPSSSILRPHANLELSGESRAPAPHLHRFRSQVAQRTQNQTGGLASQQQLNASLGSLSSMAPQISPLPPTQSSTATVSLGVLPVCHGNSVSPVDLPLEAGNLHRANLTNQTPLGEVTPASNEVPPSDTDNTRPTAMTDVVCISDDDD